MRYGYILISILIAMYTWGSAVYAAIPIMHLTWEVNVDSNYSNFALFYSHDSNMLAADQHTNCTAPVEQTSGLYKMDCVNLPFDTYPVYIQIRAVSGGDVVLSNIQVVETDPHGYQVVTFHHWLWFFKASHKHAKVGTTGLTGARIR